MCIALDNLKACKAEGSLKDVNAEILLTGQGHNGWISVTATLIHLVVQKQDGHTNASNEE